MRKRVTISLDEKFHELGKGLAKLDRRDLSAELEFLIEKEFESRRATKETTPELALNGSAESHAKAA